MSTIFDKIIRGEIPCHKVYESDTVLAFLDANPLATGHIIMIPKSDGAETLDELWNTQLCDMAVAIPYIAKAIMRVTGATSYQVLSNNGDGAGQTVKHPHFHIVPGGRFTATPRSYDGPEASAELAQAIATEVMS